MNRQSSAWIERYVAWVLRRRWLVLGLTLVLTLASAAQMTKGILSTSLANLFFGDNPKFLRHKVLVDEFGNDVVLVIGIDDPNLEQKEGLERLKRACEAIEAIEWVERAQSVATIDRVWGEDDELIISPYMDEAIKSAEAARRVVEQVRRDPLYAGLFVNDDGSRATIIVEPHFQPERPAEDWEPFSREVEEAMAEAGYSDGQLWWAGIPIHFREIITLSRHNLATRFPVACVLLLIVVFLLFRNLWPVVISMLVSLVAVVWTMGFAIMLDPKVSVIMSAVPVVMVVVAFSDTVHLCSAYMILLARGQKKDAAILQSGSEVGLACFYTSLTTCVGFASLAFVPVPIIRMVAIVLSFGVGTALLLAVTLTPVILSFAPIPEPGGQSRVLQRLVDTVLRVSLRVSTERPKQVLAAFLVALAFIVAGLLQLKLETDMTRRFDDSNPVRIGQKALEESFAGANNLDLYVATEQEDGVIEPELIGKLAHLQVQLAEIPDVNRVVSVVDLLELMHRELGGTDVTNALPETKQAIAQYLLLFEVSGGKDLERMVNFKRSRLRISLALDGFGVRRTAEVAGIAQAIAASTFPAATVEVSGLSYLTGDWLDEIIVGQQRGVVFAFLIISAVMAFSLRSLRTGFMAMLPNALPLLCLGGYLGWAWDEVDSDALLVAMIGIGIAVDDTIHFLTRYRIERERGREIDDAIRATFEFAGQAIVKTTLILSIGFTPLATSDYFSTRIIGTLLPATLIVALIADLFLVTAMAKLRMIRFSMKATG